jgi:hypothetical protein
MYWITTAATNVTTPTYLDRTFNRIRVICFGFVRLLSKEILRRQGKNSPDYDWILLVVVKLLKTAGADLDQWWSERARRTASTSLAT